MGSRPRHPKERLGETNAELSSPQALHLQAVDVNSYQSVSGLVDEVVEGTGCLGVMVNSAGVFYGMPT